MHSALLTVHVFCAFLANEKTRGQESTRVFSFLESTWDGNYLGIRTLSTTWITPFDELTHELQKKGEPTFEAVATNGTGVFDTLKAVAKQVLTELRKG